MTRPSFIQNPLRKPLLKMLFYVVTSISFSFNASAQGDLLIYPKRIVFEAGKRAQILNVANTGKDSMRFFMSVVQIRMKEDGAFEAISSADSGQRFADKYFRFFPRSVVLGPNEAQTIKMQLISSPELVPGEYRSHLYFRGEPDKKALGEEEINKDSAAISVKLVAVFGISIPVIIRVGEPDSKVSISDISIKTEKDTSSTLKIAFHRSGNMSVYGDIAVDYVSPSGKTARVATAKGLSVYTPNPLRYFVLPLDKTAGYNYKEGRLKISYSTPDEKPVKMAETEYVLH